LFLDEIGEMPTTVQAKLLRTLETGVATRLGGTKSKKYDVRIIAATNANLSDPRRFRSDLLYRLETLALRMPPLREHKEDIRLLSEHFAQTECGGKEIDESAFRVLEAYDWPGNVRQLKNAVIRASVNATKDPCIGERHINFGSSFLK
jgi:DNA-binding NtrC family response regulator